MNEETERRPRFWTVPQVAQDLGVNPSLVYQLLVSGELEGIRVGRHWRIDPAAIDRFAQRGGSVGPGDRSVVVV